MTNMASFLAAICAKPDDLQARLMFADFLEEQGQSEWASWIRLQITTTPQMTTLVAFPGEYLKYITSWIKENDRDKFCTNFKCGFAEEIACTEEFFLKYGKRLAKTTPLTRVMLTDRSPVEDNEVDTIPCWYRLGPQEPRIEPYDLDYRLWDRLKRGKKDPAPYGEFSFYRPSWDTASPTSKWVEVANEDLSDACLEWARSPN